MRGRTRTGRDTGRSATPARGRVLWPLAVCVVTGLFSAIPLLASRTFYQRGDTAAQFAPTWFHLGQLVRDGVWPPVLDPDAWAGGNYGAEALFGVYNPLNVPIWLAMSWTPNLVLMTYAIKALTLVLLALGTYLLTRDYGAKPWAAAAVAVAVPFSGFTLFWDAGSWASGLMAFTYTPWVWWSFRRTLRGTANPLWAFLIGVLAVLHGNPYGALGVVAVGAALLVEGLAHRNLRGVVRLLLVGLCVAAFLPLVFEPLLAASHLTIRDSPYLFNNNGKLRPQPGDLLGLSSPTYVAPIRTVVGSMRVPATYFCWALLPLLPWLRYAVVRRRFKDLLGPLLVGIFYLLFSLGPAQMWLFRWPIRTLEYFCLALAVLLGVVLSRGLKRDHLRERTLATAGLVLVAAFLAWAQNPRWTASAFGGTALLVALTVALLLWHRLSRTTGAVVGVLLIAGTGLVTLAQTQVFGENQSSRVWHFPADVSTLQQHFSDRHGRVMQFADLSPLQAPGRNAELVHAWDYYLAGSMYDVAGVDAVNHYTGMGYLPFTRRLCMSYDGLTRPCGYRNVWRPAGDGRTPLAELMKLDTLVVAPQQAVGVKVPAGWSSSQRGQVVVVTHDQAYPWPQSHLSYRDPGVQVTSATTVDRYHERVVLGDGEQGRVVFAMLDWPGYSATLDGTPLAVTHNPVGLLTVVVPAGGGTLEVSYRPPGQARDLAAAGLGTVGALLLSGLVLVRGRRARRRTTAEADASDG